VPFISQDGPIRLAWPAWSERSTGCTSWSVSRSELLAILGELTIDMIPEAAARAERLADRLKNGKGVTRSGGSP
jgi:hypothetical protein